jgi:hypothetical protein
MNMKGDLRRDISPYTTVDYRWTHLSDGQVLYHYDGLASGLDRKFSREQNQLEWTWKQLVSTLYPAGPIRMKMTIQDSRGFIGCWEAETEIIAG